MLPDASIVTHDQRAALGAVYRLLADELTAIKADHAENGTALVDETRAAAGAGGDRHGPAEPLD